MLWLQRWRRGWSLSLLDVVAKWLAGAREENRLDMIDRRRPRRWTHIPRDEIITEGLLIIGERCVRSLGYCGETVAFAERLLTEARSRLRVGYDVSSDLRRLILTKR